MGHSLTGSDSPDVHGVYDFIQLLSHAFEIALIHIFQGLQDLPL